MATKKDKLRNKIRRGIHDSSGVLLSGVQLLDAYDKYANDAVELATENAFYTPLKPAPDWLLPILERAVTKGVEGAKNAVHRLNRGVGSGGGGSGASDDGGNGGGAAAGPASELGAAASPAASEGGGGGGGGGGATPSAPRPASVRRA